jgi:hypothetical protein
MLIGGIWRIPHDANVHGLSNRYSNCLARVVVDEVRRTFEENTVRVFVNVELAKRLQRIAPTTLDFDGKLVAPTPRQPYSSLRRPEIAVLVEEKRVHPLRGTVCLLIGRDLVAIGEVVQIDPGTVGEAQRRPLPRIREEIAPLAVYPALPGYANLSRDTTFSGVGDPTHDLDTR